MGNVDRSADTLNRQAGWNIDHTGNASRVVIWNGNCRGIATSYRLRSTTATARGDIQGIARGASGRSARPSDRYGISTSNRCRCCANRHG